MPRELRDINEFGGFSPSEARHFQLKISAAGEMKIAIKSFLNSCDRCRRGEKHNALHTRLRIAMEDYLNVDVEEDA